MRQSRPDYGPDFQVNPFKLLSLSRRGRYIAGHQKKGIQAPMAQGRSTKVISMIKWIRTNRLSIKNSLFSLFTRRH